MYQQPKDTARPRFYTEAVQNKYRSEQEGRPIFETKEFVEIMIPGDKHLTWVGEVTDEHRNRWPDIYAAFKRGEQRAVSGTPLEQWPVLATARVAELKAMNILTVEEMANVADGMLPKLGIGAREEREQARAFLEKARGGADVAKMAAELAQLKEMVARLQGGAVTPAEPEEPRTKALEECTDQELKEYIKRETGESVRGNPSRDTLMQKAAEIAAQAQEAA